MTAAAESAGGATREQAAGVASRARPGNCLGMDPGGYA